MNFRFSGLLIDYILVLMIERQPISRCVKVSMHGGTSVGFVMTENLLTAYQYQVDVVMGRKWELIGTIII